MLKLFAKSREIPVTTTVRSQVRVLFFRYIRALRRLIEIVFPILIFTKGTAPVTKT